MELNLKKNSNADIFIYSHIPFKPVTKDMLFKVLTHSEEDAECFNTDLAIYRDYTGDNIADVNLMYNEYCGFYWIWKNYPIKDYVGMMHYRRMYLTDDGKRILDGEHMPVLDDIFKDYSIILNEKFEMVMPSTFPDAGKKCTNYEWYEFWHNIDDLNLFGEIIKDKYPEYEDGFKKMCDAKYIYPSSLFIMKKDMFEDYCKFIFGVLGEFRKRRGFYRTDDCVKYVEEHKDKYLDKGPGHGYYDTKMQSRIVGYIAERVLQTYLMHDDGNGSIESKAKFMKWAVLAEKIYEA